MIRSLLLKLGNQLVADDPLLPEEAQAKLAKLGKSINRLEALLVMTYYYAFQGEAWAVNFVADRTEGRVPEATNAGVTDQRSQILVKIDEMVKTALPQLPTLTETTAVVISSEELL